MRNILNQEIGVNIFYTEIGVKNKSRNRRKDLIHEIAANN
jgi:hypothetical protein